MNQADISLDPKTTRQPAATEPPPITQWGKAKPTLPAPRQRRLDALLLLIPILLVGAYLRWLNVDWDEGQHLHPDERYLTMVVGRLQSPKDLGQFLNSYDSPLNPFNQGDSNYAYGTLPLFIVHYTGEWLNHGCAGVPAPQSPESPVSSPSKLQNWMAQQLFGPEVKHCVGDQFTSYGYVHLLGRALAALADVGVILFLFFTGRRLYGQWVGLLAAGLYAFAALPIQQAHFFTVDPYANFFIAVSLYFGVRASQDGKWPDFGLAGLNCGLALACKASVWPFVGVIVLVAVLLHLRGCRPQDQKIALDALMLLLAGLAVFMAAATAALGLYTAVKLTLYLGIVALLTSGMLLWLRRFPTRRGFINVDGAMARLMLAGLMTFIAFRLTQPYAFAGLGFDVDRWQSPEYDWFRPYLEKSGGDNWEKLYELMPDPVRAVFLPDPRFLAAMGSVQGQLTGETDVPWGHQWANRTPLLFPWTNMVVWGMGIPLGLTVWLAWLLAARDLGRGKRRLAHLLPWMWVLFLFFYQGTQWVKSIRYVLPIYPSLILLAAWLLLGVLRVARALGQRFAGSRLGLVSYALRAVVVLLVVGALLWGWGFSRIYARPVTRNAASRWMRDNVPTAATLHYTVAGQPRQLFVNMGATFTYPNDEIFQVHKLTLPPEQGVAEVQIMGITFTHLGDPQADSEPETFQVRLAADPSAEKVLAHSEQALYLEKTKHSLGDSYTFDLGAVPVPVGREYYLFTQATAGAPVSLNTTVIANEHFDDELPNRVDGFNPYGGAYRGLQSSADSHLRLYDNESELKRQEIYEWLEEADYISMSSNRLYGSIPRIPIRFPLAIEYYRALFAEELGFELVASFTSFVNVGPFQFPDQETPFAPDEPTLVDLKAAPISIYLPPAEEAFSVYDHPQVFLFRKTDDYSRQKVEALLERVNLSQVTWMTALQATQTPNALMLTDEEWQRQRAGGNWSDIFSPDALINRSPVVGVLLWWMLLYALGLFAMPLLFVALPGLPDRGYPLSKTLGLLLWAVLAWWAGNTNGFLRYSQGMIFACLLLMALAAAVVFWQRRQQIWLWARREWRSILVSELLFNALFFAFLLVRYADPDVWHPVMGGERPMELAYISAIVKSTSFPPYDPWFAGGAINYYYFGWVMVATPIKLLGLLPEIAFNLALPTFFAMTGAAAYSLAYNLVARCGLISEHRDKAPGRIAAVKALFPQHTLAPILVGLTAAVFVVVLGNLDEIRLLVSTLYDLGERNFSFKSTIPGLRELVTLLRGLWQAVVKSRPMPWYPNWPYWNASRLIPHPPTEAGPISEFPFFSFIYGDLHPHLMSMPLTLTALAFGLNWVFDSGFWRLRIRQSALHGERWISALCGLALGGLVVGALRPTNTWDYATVLVLAALFLVLGHLLQRDSGWGYEALRDRLLTAGGRFGLLVGLTYLFFLPYINRYATGYTSAETWKGSKTPLWAYLMIHALFLYPIATWLILKAWRWAQRQNTTGNAFGIVLTLALLSGVIAALALLKGYQVAVVVIPLGALTLAPLFDERSRPAERFVALLTGASLALTLLVEVVVLKGDIGRMNTVFKFYLQVWLMLGVSAAACLFWLLPSQQPKGLSNPSNALGGSLWLGIMALLLFLAALYPLFATWAKVNDRYVRSVGPGLNGLEWMKEASTTQGALPGEPRTYPLLWDYQAFMWLREKVYGSPVVAEGANGPAYRSLRSGVASFTGLPIIIGYDWHQRQQRSALKSDAVGQRARDVNDLYNTHDAQHALALLDRYQVGLIYLGQLEQSYYDPQGLAKFDMMVERGWLSQVYQNEGVIIYQVNR